MISFAPKLGIWEREKIDLPYNFINKFRKDIPSDFKQFMSGKLLFCPQNLEEMEDWLKKCVYITDKDQFGKKDYWQHPLEFEKNMKGDCEDHSLWAWRILREMGYSTELVFGYLRRGGLHAWVHFYKGEQFFLMEPTEKKTSIILSFDKIKDKYIPYWSIDNYFQSYVYGGFAGNFEEK